MSEPREKIMTPDEIEESRRHVAAMTDGQLGKLYIEGPDKWPGEAWEMLTQEFARRKRTREVGQFLSTESETRPKGTTSFHQRSVDRRPIWRIFGVLDLVIAAIYLMTGSPVRALVWLMIGLGALALSLREPPQPPT